MKVPESKVAKFKKPKEVLSKKQIKAFEEMVNDRIDRQKHPEKYAQEKLDTEVAEDDDDDEPEVYRDVPNVSY